MYVDVVDMCDCATSRRSSSTCSKVLRTKFFEVMLPGAESTSTEVVSYILALGSMKLQSINVPVSSAYMGQEEHKSARDICCEVDRDLHVLYPRIQKWNG